MPGSALVRRAVVAIAAVLLLAQAANAQSETDLMVEKFAREGERSQAKQEAARQAEAAKAKLEAEQKAEEAKARKDSERKAAQAAKSLEVRRQAEAQRLKAEARNRAEAAQSAEEDEMLARARQEADEAKATSEIRRLIERAEAERLRAEDLIAQEEGKAPVNDRKLVLTEPITAAAQDKDEADAAKLDAASPDADVRAPLYPQVTDMARRLRHAQQARRTALAQREADEAEAQRMRLAEQAHAMHRRITDRAVLVQRFARVHHWRHERAVAENLRVAQAAEAERARQAEAMRAKTARLVYQRVADRKTLALRLGHVRHVREARLAAQARATAVAGSQVPTSGKASGPEIAAAPQPSVPPAPTPAPGPGDQIAPTPPAFPGRSALGGAPDGRVTVLLIMVPGTYGIRRGATVADPILCAMDGCYVSGGPGSPAWFLRGRKALGVGNTLGGRAGACRHSLGCVFRAVDLALPEALQPVDLHILKHDRKRPQVITSDSDCQLAAGRISCNRAFRAEDYTLWILPEWLAASAGPEELDRAVREGVAPARSADAGPPR